MSSALKERLARGRRRRSSFQSPVQNASKRLCESTSSASPTCSPPTATAVLPKGAKSSESDTEDASCTPSGIRMMKSKQQNSRGDARSCEVLLRDKCLPVAALGFDGMSGENRSDPSTTRQTTAGSESGQTSPVVSYSSVHSTDVVPTTPCDSRQEGQPSSLQKVTVPLGDTDSHPVLSAAGLDLPATPSFVAPLVRRTSNQEDHQSLSPPEAATVGGDCLEEEHERLTAQLATKHETLRKLKLVQLYRNKHKPEELVQLVRKWRLAGQEALQVLHAWLAEPRPSMTEFLQLMNVDLKLMKFDITEEMFCEE